MPETRHATQLSSGDRGCWVEILPDAPGSNSVPMLSFPVEGGVVRFLILENGVFCRLKDLCGFLLYPTVVHAMEILPLEERRKFTMPEGYESDYGFTDERWTGIVNADGLRKIIAASSSPMAPVVHSWLTEHVYPVLAALDASLCRAEEVRNRNITIGIPQEVLAEADRSYGLNDVELFGLMYGRMLALELMDRYELESESSWDSACKLAAEAVLTSLKSMGLKCPDVTLPVLTGR